MKFYSTLIQTNTYFSGVFTDFDFFLENPNIPLLVFKPPIPMVNLEYNQKDPNSLVSGMTTGQVAAWDTRKGPDPVEMSLRENSHREPVTATLWINSKSGSEFFTSSLDGSVKW